MDFQIGKKIIIIDPTGYESSLILKCKRVRRDDISSDIDISKIPAKERKIVEYVMNLNDQNGHIATVLSPDELMLDEINETIRNLERSKREIESKINNELNRYQELREKVQLHTSVDEFAPKNGSTISKW